MSTRTSRRTCHECSCHLNPPCYACVNCNHWEAEDCEHNCQDCVGHRA